MSTKDEQSNFNWAVIREPTLLFNVLRAAFHLQNGPSCMVNKEWRLFLKVIFHYDLNDCCSYRPFLN